MLQSFAYMAGSGYLTWIGGGNNVEMCLLPSLSFLASVQCRHLGGLSSLMVVCCYNIIKTNLISSAARIVYVNSKTVENPVRNDVDTVLTFNLQ